MIDAVHPLALESPQHPGKKRMWQKAWKGAKLPQAVGGTWRLSTVKVAIWIIRHGFEPPLAKKSRPCMKRFSMTHLSRSAIKRLRVIDPICQARHDIRLVLQRAMEVGAEAGRWPVENQRGGCHQSRRRPKRRATTRVTTVLLLSVFHEPLSTVRDWMAAFLVVEFEKSLERHWARRRLSGSVNNSLQKRLVHLSSVETVRTYILRTYIHHRRTTVWESRRIQRLKVGGVGTKRSLLAVQHLHIHTDPCLLLLTTLNLSIHTGRYPRLRIRPRLSGSKLCITFLHPSMVQVDSQCIETSFSFDIYLSRIKKLIIEYDQYTFTSIDSIRKYPQTYFRAMNPNKMLITLFFSLERSWLWKRRANQISIRPFLIIFCWLNLPFHL